MAIINMFGFDQMPEIANITPDRMALEGFDEIAITAGTGYRLSTVVRDGRMRLQGAIVRASSSSSRIARQWTLTAGPTLSAWFGSPSKLTKGWIGLRVHVNDKWSEVDTLYMYMLNGGWSGNSGSIVPSLVPGEHYIEFGFDFKNSAIEVWINGERKFVHQEILTLASSFSIGQYSAGPMSANSAVIDYSDIYVLYDTEDDTPCDRLGPVQVKWLPVQKATVPGDWDYLADDLYRHVSDGVTREYHSLIPTYLESDLKPGVKLSQDLSAAELRPIVNPAGSSYITRSGTNVDDTVTVQVEFDSPKRASGYVLMGHSSPNYGFMEDWTFEASHNGLEWTVLDTKRDQASTHNTLNAIVHDIPVASREFYTHYRILSTRQGPGSTDSKTVRIYHFQLLGTLEDRRLNISAEEQANLPYNANALDTAVPVFRTSVSESEAAFQFEAPVVGSAEIKMVQLRLAGKRDPGTEERLVTRSEVGGIASEDKDLRMDTDFRFGPILENLHTDHLNKTWVADTVGQLKLIVKSKTGEA